MPILQQQPHRKKADVMPKTIHPSAVPYTSEQLKAIFKKHDINGDNLLSKGELEEAFKELGSLVPLWRAYRGLHHADANKDGFISEAEMKDLVKYAHELAFKMH